MCWDFVFEQFACHACDDDGGAELVADVVLDY